MKNLSDEELVRKYIISHIQCFIKSLPEHHQWSKERDSLKFELLYRLSKGRKAIEAMKEIIEADSKEVESNEFNAQLYHIIDDYQQSCKESAE